MAARFDNAVCDANRYVVIIAALFAIAAVAAGFADAAITGQLAFRPCRLVAAMSAARCCRLAPRP